MEKDKLTHIYKPNSFFENALDLYFFDKKLRLLIFAAIQSFEIALRSKLINKFAIKYGPFWINNQSLFSDKDIFADCLLRVQQEVRRSKEDFIQKYFIQYSNPEIPPVWKTLEVVSFGVLSKVLCNLSDNALKKMIAREFKLPQHKCLESWCKCAVNMRNYLAHHSRVWNRVYPIRPYLPKTLSSSWIDISNIEHNKLYPQICCLSYLQNSIHPHNDFKHRLRNLITEYPNVDVTAMGFPSDWEQEPLWS